MQSHLMIVGVSAVFHLLFPLGLALWFARSANPSSVLEWAVARLALMTYTLLIVLVGAAWHIYGIHTRWLLLATTLMLCLSGWSALNEVTVLPETSRSAWKNWLKVTICSLLVLFFGLQLVSVLTISAPDQNPVRLKNPFKEGRYLVVHGGPVGLNHHAGITAQRHALDIVKLNSIGTRASGLLPANPSAYEIFGEPLYAPCSGTILQASDDRPDQPPPRRDREHPPGNSITLDCGEHTVVLAHLNQDSLSVQQGETVETGTRLASVGNTGNTTEPHLHIHAVEGRRKETRELFSEGVGVPIHFRGLPYPLIRHSTFTPQEPD